MVNFINLKKENKNNLIFDKPGDYVVYFKNLSGNFIFDITSPKVNLDIYGLYIGNETQEFKLHTIQHHASPSSQSNLFIKGIFRDFSKFNYEGLIRIEKQAQKSHAYQKNQNLILSPYCFVESRPYLEILANDVFCTHGSTIGKPDWQQLFYLKSRGLNQEDAEKLLVDGFINELITKIRKKVPNFVYNLDYPASLKTTS